MSRLHQNPFNDTTEDPFADESIHAALVSSGAPQGYSLPSSHVELMEAPAPRIGGTSALPAAASASTAAADWAKREAELRRREEALAQREQSVQQQEAALRAHGLHPPNWPPFYPLIYHDIDQEVPESSRVVVTKIYNYWLSTVVALLINAVACLAILASHSTTTGGTDFGGALIYSATITALSFFAWYRPVYTAFAKDSSLFFYIFLLFEGLHILFAAYMTVGLPGSGSAGLINLLSVLTDGKYVAAAFCSLPKILTQVVIASTQIFGRAFVEAYKNVSASAAANAGARGAMDAATRNTGMTVDEAELILNLKKAGDVHAVGREEIMKRYEHLFKANDPAEGGSFYLQSKIVRAKERLEMELDKDNNKQ